MTTASTERHESAVARWLVDEVMNERRLDVLDELCTPAMARRWRRWAAVSCVVPGRADLLTPDHADDVADNVGIGN